MSMELLAAPYLADAGGYYSEDGCRGRAASSTSKTSC